MMASFRRSGFVPLSTGRSPAEVGGWRFLLLSVGPLQQSAPGRPRGYPPHAGGDHPTGTIVSGLPSVTRCAPYSPVTTEPFELRFKHRLSHSSRPCLHLCSALDLGQCCCDKRLEYGPSFFGRE